MKLATRPQLARLMEIDQALRKGDWPNCSKLAGSLEVDVRTILRDIEFMRDRLKAPIEYDASRRGYFYTQPTYRLSYFQTTTGELVALLVAEKLLKQFQGTPFESGLRQAFEKLTSLLPEHVSVQLAKVQETLSVTPTVLTIQDVETFNTVSTALQQNRQLEIDYWTASRNARGKRVIDPYHLTLIDGDWQIVAFCHQRGDIRMFAVHRVKAATLREETFKRPISFNIQNYLKGSFRAVRGSQSHQVELLFTPEVAGRVQEKIWHPSQKMEMQNNGSVRLSVEVNSLVEIKRWVLWWGKDCRVLGPPEFMKAISFEMTKCLRHYQKNA